MRRQGVFQKSVACVSWRRAMNTSTGYIQASHRHYQRNGGGGEEEEEGETMTTSPSIVIHEHTKSSPRPTLAPCPTHAMQCCFASKLDPKFALVESTTAHPNCIACGPFPSCEAWSCCCCCW